MKDNIKWNSSLEAQRIADEAFSKLKNKPKEKRMSKKDKRRLKNKSKRLHKKRQFTSYKDYINSPEWKELKAKVIKLRGCQCEICGNTQNLQLHHKTYVRLYNELLEDLQLVCGGCHTNIHEGYKGIVDPMTKRYLDFIKSSS